MNIKLIEDMPGMVQFLNNPDMIKYIVSEGDSFALSPDTLYLGIYERDELVGVYEIRTFWRSVIECHGTYHPNYRGSFALRSYKAICKWLLENLPFTNAITTVPDNAKFGRSLVVRLGARRVGHMDDAFVHNGQVIGVTWYQLTRREIEGIVNANFPVSSESSK